MKFSTLACVGAVINGEFKSFKWDIFTRTNNNSSVKLKDSIPNNKVNGANGHRGFHALKHVVMEQEQD